MKDWRDEIVREKMTIYYLAQLITDTQVTLSEEHTELSWANKQATKTLIPKFTDLQLALDEAEEIIQ